MTKRHVVFIGLQVLDFATTALVFKLGGFEANPVAKILLSLFSGIGPVAGQYCGLAVAKIGASVVSLRVRTRLLNLGILAYTLIVFWNLFIATILALQP